MRGRIKGNKNAVRKIFESKKREVITDNICAFFGCNKKLTGFESLAGKMCFKHSQLIQQDLLKKQKTNYES